MRIYGNVLEAVREVERDLYEMGIDVHPQTMQDKTIINDPNYGTKEVRAYGFKIAGYRWNRPDEHDVCYYLMHGHLGTEGVTRVLAYIEKEFKDRISGTAMNPGNSWAVRPEVWQEFLHDGKFAYTYSERMAPQVEGLVQEFKEHPDTRQGIITIHSYICPLNETVQKIVRPDSPVVPSSDWNNKGGVGRIPCSMYYQLMIREHKLDLIYTMRSCDFLTHFPVDLMLALRLQDYIARQLTLVPGMFTYFTGSLHAYNKDMRARGIF